jgi:hypothetical protein
MMDDGEDSLRSGGNLQNMYRNLTTDAGEGKHPFTMKMF